MKPDPRIAVVGGGPAGATVSRLLASSRSRVTMFEARTSAEKPCGGAIPSGVLQEFPELLDPCLKRRIVRDIVVYSPANRRVRLHAVNGVHMFDRQDLDSFLRRRAEAAGAVLVRSRVKALRSLPGGRWELLTEKGHVGPFDYLIGADGVQGVVRREVARVFQPRQLTLALYAYVPGVGCSEMVLKMFGNFDGYLWMFPRAERTSIGICATHHGISVARLREELFSFIAQYYPGVRFSEKSLKGYFIPSDFDPPGSGAGAVEGATWALLGDAAGCVDPLTREGIAHAMRSAVTLAARVAAGDGLRTPQLPANLVWAHRHSGGFFRERFLEEMVSLADASGAIRKVLVDLFEGRQGYRGLKGRLLLNAVPCGLQVALGVLGKFTRKGGTRPTASR